MDKINTKFVLYQLSKIGYSFLAPNFLGRKKIPFGPSFVSLEAEDGCNLRCLHCDIWEKERSPKRMNLKQMKEAVLRLKNWLGIFQLNLTGGEPFLNKDIIPLIEFASTWGILVHTNSNGFLIDQKLAREIVKSELNSLSISLDSLKPEKYNKLRGNKEAFQRAIRALEMISEIRRPTEPFLSITTVVMRQNLGELEKLVHWTKEQGLDAIFFQAIWQNFDAGYDPTWFKSSDFWPHDLKKVKKVMNRLIQLKKEGYPIGNKMEDFKRYNEYFANPVSFGKSNPCFVGVNNFDVDITGKVRLCFNFPRVGNILKEKPENIWNGKRAQAQRLEIARCERGCKILLCNTPMSRKEALLMLANKIKRLPKRLIE
ncbi:radical SAM protein [Patescibacteria group bacterium]|nr:radical SAM protein [Patescibacteria group bacterium]